jgi:hypothetical protein
VVARTRASGRGVRVVGDFADAHPGVLGQLANGMWSCLQTLCGGGSVRRSRYDVMYRRPRRARRHGMALEPWPRWSPTAGSR